MEGRSALRSRHMRKREPATARHSGFTLVELLVVIAIIGLLLAILVPAVGGARESARRLACLNNLKQIGLAAEGYHSTNSVLPPSVEDVNRSIVTEANWGWLPRFLPHLELQPAFDGLLIGQVPFGTMVTSPGTTDTAYASFRTMALQPVSTFLCPSGAMQDSRVSETGFKGTSYPSRFAPCNYAASFGMNDISGTSANLFWNWNPATITTAYPLNSVAGTWGRVYGFGSAHPGGGNFVMLDGSTRFVDDAVEFGNPFSNPPIYGIYQKWAVRNDGLPISAE